MLTILAFCSAVLMINCSSVITKDPGFQREWMLICFENYSKQDLIKYKARVDLSSSNENGKIKGSAYMGCNKIFFYTEFRNSGKLKISGLGSTMMACPDMKLEDDFSKRFKNMSYYQVDGHFLTLTDRQGYIMKFVAADWD
ncbi:META domain-containing protein [Chryseobacterium sp. SSA4.19]|uniref:META domain-containing protein n=1 Tax=Chryseobacterium sp. SSA4.19 TaxID=2919915 RepID=UPI001F4D736B|nr:META domain-containing protein [Chryseobacterium sp. SSA4.19]MCJ8155594.1 META domain-containing protein [Chryseobacterium sp. SSA4.19]